MHGQTMQQRALYVMGIVITVACAGYVLYELIENEVWRVDRETFYALGWYVPAAALVYAVTSISLGAAWWRLLRWSGEPVSERAICHGIYGRSQLAKYVPGNVFSFVGRQVLGRRAGFSHRGLAVASVLEIAGQVLSAGMIMLIGSQFSSTPEVDYTVQISLLGIAGFAVAVALTLVTLRKLAKTANQPLLKRTVLDFAHLMLNFSIYILFFLVGGTLLWVILTVIADHRAIEWTYVLSVGAAAWILGFIVPGAPGGIGVRDALLIAGLAPIVGGPAATIATIAYRIVTVIGDIVYFLISYAFPIRKTDRIEE